MQRRLYWLSGCVLLSLFGLSLAIGATTLSWSEFWAACFKQLRHESLTAGEAWAWTVLIELRLPRVLTAIFCGAALGAAGAISQGLFRESLASPTIIGTEAGGSLAAALVFYFGAAMQHWLILPLAALAGALLASLLVIAVARRAAGYGSATPVGTLLLAGFAVNALLGAAISLLVTLAMEDPQRAARALSWLVGGLAARGYEHVGIVLVCFVLGTVLLWSLAPRLDVLSLGEQTAASLAIDPVGLRRRALAAMAILVGGAVSVAGAIPFVGLVVPHAVRRLAGPQHQHVLVLSAINGASLVLLADGMARSLRAPMELQVGVLTAFVGAPFFLMLLWSRRDRSVVSRL